MSENSQKNNPNLPGTIHQVTDSDLAIALRHGSSASSFSGINSLRDDDIDKDPNSPATSISTVDFGFPSSSKSSFSLDPTFLNPWTGEQSFHDGDNLPMDNLSPPDLISFNKGNQSFKLNYSRIRISKLPNGELRRIELFDTLSPGLPASFIHTFPSSKLPVPHIEQPVTLESKPPYIVSFLEEQMVSAAGVVFSAQPHYIFNNLADCNRFQETILGQQLIFIGGIAKCKSKGRGEESISQNLRVWGTGPSGKKTILIFANSQRKENKRYLAVPVSHVDSIDQRKDSVVLKLSQTTSQAVAKLKVLHFDFLSSDDAKKFYTVMDQALDKKQNQPMH